MCIQLTVIGFNLTRSIRPCTLGVKGMQLVSFMTSVNFDSTMYCSCWFGLSHVPQDTHGHAPCGFIIQATPLWFPPTHTPRYNGGSLSDGGGEGEVRAGETVDTGSSPWRPVPGHAKNTGRTADTMTASFSFIPCYPLTPSLLAKVHKNGWLE